MFERDLGADVKQVTDAWRATVADAIGEGVEDGSIRADVDACLAADLLITLVDGLCTRWLAGTMGRDRARGLLSDALRRTLAPLAQ